MEANGMNVAVLVPAQEQKYAYKCVKLNVSVEA